LSKPTYVYVMTEEATEYSKIGVSNQVFERLKALQIGNPRRLVLNGVIEHASATAAYQHEDELHRRFTEYRVLGEWFRLPVEVIASLGLNDFYPERPPRRESLLRTKAPLPRSKLTNEERRLRRAVDRRRSADCLDEATIRF
jgi:hypothetical protein